MLQTEDGTGGPAAAIGNPAAAVKLIDFGLAARIPPDRHLLVPDMRVGKDKYMAPEVHAMLPYSPAAADAWTVGMVAWYLLTGRELYQRADPVQCPVFGYLAAGRLRDVMAAWRLDGVMSPAAVDLIASLLQVDPWMRPSLAAVQQHAWFASAGLIPPPPAPPGPPAPQPQPQAPFAPPPGSPAAGSGTPTSAGSSESYSGIGSPTSMLPSPPPSQQYPPVPGYGGSLAPRCVHEEDLALIGCCRREGAAGGLVRRAPAR
jgi:calcium-dependent protein kinase